MDASDASFATVKEDEGTSSVCAVCLEGLEATAELACAGCLAPLHYRCRDVPLHGPTGKPNASVLKFLASSWCRVLCDRCSREDVPAEAPPSEDSLAATVASLAASVSQQQKSLATLTALVTGQPSADGKTKPQASSKPAAVLTQMLTSAKEEELRLRSAVIDGLPAQEGVSDQELLDELFSFLNLDKNTVRVESCHRMGNREQACPKLKVTLWDRRMLAALVSKETRAKLKAAGCPALYSGVFLNPSRTAEERHRLHLLRRRRDELNSAAGLATDQDGWFVDYRRAVLVQKVGGQPDWKGPGDVGYDAWAAKQPPPPRRQPPATPASSSTGKSDRPATITGGKDRPSGPPLTQPPPPSSAPPAKSNSRRPLHSLPPHKQQPTKVTHNKPKGNG